MPRREREGESGEWEPVKEFGQGETIESLEGEKVASVVEGQLKYGEERKTDNIREEIKAAFREKGVTIKSC